MREQLLVDYALVGTVLVDEVHAAGILGDDVGQADLRQRTQPIPGGGYGRRRRSLLATLVEFSPSPERFAGRGVAEGRGEVCPSAAGRIQVRQRLSQGLLARRGRATVGPTL